MKGRNSSQEDPHSTLARCAPYRSAMEKRRFLWLNKAIAIALMILVLLLSANTALAWLVDEDLVVNEMSLGQVEEPIYAAVIKTKDAPSPVLVFGKGAISSDDPDVVEVFYDLADGSSLQTVPWKDHIGSIEAVIFKDKIEPKDTGFWFDGASKLKEIVSIENLDMSSVSSAQAMFRDCSSLESIDMSGVSATDLKDLNGMFEGCSSLKSLNLEGITTSDTDLDTSRIFEGCSSLEEITIPSSFAFSGTDTGESFLSPEPSIVLDADGNWYIDGVDGAKTPSDAAIYVNERRGSGKDPITLRAYGSGYAALYGTVLVFGRGTPMDIHNGSALSATYHGIETGSGDFNPNNSNLYGTSPWPTNLTAVESVAKRPIKTPSIRGWFFYNTNLRSVDLSSIDLSECTSMQSAFQYCRSLAEMDVSYWNVSNVSNMQEAFAQCQILQRLDVSSWNTENVTTLAYAFNGCTKLEALDVSRWRLPKLGATSGYNGGPLIGTFDSCTKLEAIDTSNWGVITTDGFFGGSNNVSRTFVTGCTNLKVLDLSGITITETTADSSNRNWWNFTYCPNLEQLVVPSTFCTGNTNILSALNSNRNGYVNSNYWYEEGQGLSLDGSDVARRMQELYNSQDSPAKTTFYSYKTFTDEDAYAAYYVNASTGDKPFVFGRGATIPETYEGATLSNVYREIEDRCGGSQTGNPWYNVNQYITRVSIDTDLSPKNCGWWFSSAIVNKSYAGLEKINMGECASADHMFYSNRVIEVMDIPSWSFDRCSTFTYMFRECMALKEMNVKGWTFSDVLGEDAFTHMFGYCRAITELDLSGWSLTQTAGRSFNFGDTFAGCWSLQKISFPHLAGNASKVRGNVSSAYYFGGTFYECGDLREIVVPNDFSFDAVIIPNGKDGLNDVVTGGRWYEDRQGTGHDATMLQDALSSRFKDGGADSHWYVEKNWTDGDAYAALYGDTLVFARGAMVDETHGEQSLQAVYRELEADGFRPAWWGDTRNANASIKHIEFNATIHPKSLGSWFVNLRALEDIEGLEKLDTAAVSDLSYMFYRCETLPSLDVSSFDMGNAQNLYRMFEGCGSVDLKLFTLDTKNVSNMQSLFNGCKAKSIDISSWKIDSWMDSSVTSVMFRSPYLEEMILPPSFYFSTVSDYELERDTDCREGYIAARCWYENGEGRPYSPVDTVNRINAERNTKAEPTRWTRYPVEDAYAAVFKDQYSSDLTLEFGRGNLEALKNRYQNKVLKGIALGFEYYPWSNLNISNTPWSNAFGTSNFKSVWMTDTVKAVDINGWFMNFYECSAFDLSKLDTSDVTNMMRTFASCRSVEEMDLSSWDTSEMIYIGNGTGDFAPFNSCISMKKLNISGWDFSSAGNNPQDMLTNCTSLEEIDMSGCIYGNAPRLMNPCYKLKRVTISPSVSFSGDFFMSVVDEEAGCDGNWYTEADRTKYTPAEARALINERYQTTTEPITFIVGYGRSPYAAVYKDTLSNARKLVFGRGFADSSVDGLELETISRDLEMHSYNTLGGSPLNSTVPWKNVRQNIIEVVNKVPSDDPIRPLSLNSWFYEMNKITTLDMSMFDVSNANDIGCALYGCTSLSDLRGIATWNTSNVQNMSTAFAGVPSNFQTSITGWDTSAVKNMSWIFWGCTGLTSLDLSGWSTTSLAENENAFYQCTNLVNLDLPASFVKATMTSLGQMFLECRSLKTIDTSDWNTSGLMSLNSLFYNCRSLQSIVAIDDWDTSSITEMDEAFVSCEALNADLSDWDVAKVKSHKDFAKGAAESLIEPLWDQVDDPLSMSQFDLSSAQDQKVLVSGDKRIELDEDAKPMSEGSLKVASFTRKAVGQLIFKVDLRTGKVVRSGYYR